MSWTDGETGLPIEIAEKIKKRLKMHEEKIMSLEVEKLELLRNIAKIQEREQQLIYSVGILTEKINELINRLAKMEGAPEP